MGFGLGMEEVGLLWACGGPDGPLLTLDKEAFRTYCEEKQGGPWL